MKTKWNKENKPHLFATSGRSYCKLSPEEIEERGFLSGFTKELVSILPPDCWLAGSWFESIYRGEQPKDYDIFFKNEQAVENFMDLFLLGLEVGDDETNKLKGYESPTKDAFAALLDNENTTAVSIKHDSKPTIQLVKSCFYDSSEALIDTFDFTACQFAIGQEGLVFNPCGMLDMVRKRLVLHRMTFPASTLRRMIKYTQKGYFACGGSLVNLVYAVKDCPQDEQDTLYVD